MLRHDNVFVNCLKTALEFPLLLSYMQNRQSPIWFSATCTIITLVLNFNMLNHFTPTEH